MELTHTATETRPGWFEQYLPAPEAAKRIKTLSRRNRKTRRTRAVYLTIEQRGRTDDTHYFPILGSVKITKAAAIRFVTENYKNFTERGALVHLVWCDDIVFVG